MKTKDKYKSKKKKNSLEYLPSDSRISLLAQSSLLDSHAESI